MLNLCEENLFGAQKVSPTVWIWNCPAASSIEACFPSGGTNLRSSESHRRLSLAGGSRSLETRLWHWFLIFGPFLHFVPCLLWEVKDFLCQWSCYWLVFPSAGDQTTMSSISEKQLIVILSSSTLFASQVWSLWCKRHPNISNWFSVGWI